MKLTAVSGTILTLLLVSMLTLAFNIQPTEAEPTTIIVPDDYEKIQWAIGNVSDGDTIFVKAGTYYEHIIVDKSTSLIGENKSTTIVDGNFTGTVIKIEADNVDITGFTIRNGGADYPDSGIRTYSSNGHNISNNIVTNNGYGIWLQESSNNTMSKNNITKNDCTGINLFSSSGNTISENNITKNTGGIGLNYSSNNTISGNNIIKNGLDINGIGIGLGHSSDNTISGNNIIANNGHGIRFGGSSSNRISGNSIIDSYYGIYIDFSSNDNVLASNLVNKNTYAVLLDLSYNNTFYHNTFIDNTLVYIRMDGYRNFWDHGYPSGGNYWSDYNGTDANHDGIGDAAYFIDANNTDNYPLIGTFNSYNVTYFTPPLVPHACNVTVISNSTISDFGAPISIEHPEVTSLMFNASGAEGSTGFCRVSFPTAMMNGTYHVSVNGTEIPCTLLPCSDANYSYLYFTYTHPTETVIIITEFPSILILPLFMIATLLTVIVYRRKHSM